MKKSTEALILMGCAAAFLWPRPARAAAIVREPDVILQVSTKEEAPDEILIESAPDLSAEAYLGEYLLTAYCGCSKCCGKNAKKDGSGRWMAITRSGVRARPSHTIAVDPEVIPLGSKVRIGGTVYTAEDTGGKWVQGKHIDIFFENHAEAKAFGTQHGDVYLITE